MDEKGGRGAGEQMQRSGGKEREEGLTLSFALGSAPLASSSEAASVLPLLQAQCSGVQPSSGRERGGKREHDGR